MKEKRRDIPRVGSDRRVIERFSDARVAMTLRQTQMWLRVLTGIVLVAAGGEVVEGIVRGEARGFLSNFFISTFLVILAVLFWQYSAAIGFYLNNESVENLNRTFDRQHTFWKTVGIFSVLFAIVFVVLKM